VAVEPEFAWTDDVVIDLDPVGPKLDELILGHVSIPPWFDQHDVGKGERDKGNLRSFDEEVHVVSKPFFFFDEEKSSGLLSQARKAKGVEA
jgi:hypothetical protein